MLSPGKMLMLFFLALNRRGLWCCAILYELRTHGMGPLDSCCKMWKIGLFASEVGGLVGTPLSTQVVLGFQVR